MATDEAPDDPIRVLIADLSDELAQSVIQLVEQQSDMELVGRVEEPVATLLFARRGADVLILGTPQLFPPPGICSHLLAEIPTLKILVLSIETGDMVGYWLGVHSRLLPAMSSELLVKTIRQLYLETPTL